MDGNDDAIKKPNTTAPPRVEKSRTVASTKWIALESLDWVGPDGVQRAWDRATRTTKKGTAADGVIIVPLLRNDEGTLDTLLVEQFRPPVETTTIEFPAGLVDDNETVEQAALRELREETGYVGEACKVAPIASQLLCMSPGLCNETVHVVLVEVDLNNPYNKNPKQQLDSGEFCSVKRVSLKEGLQSVLNDTSSMPLMGLYMFALGWDLGKKSAEA